MGVVMQEDYQNGFFKMCHQILEDQRFIDLKPATKVLFIYLCKHQNRFVTSENTFFRSLRQLCQDTGLDLATILTARKELVLRGFITVSKGQSSSGKGNSSSWYQVVSMKGLLLEKVNNLT